MKLLEVPRLRPRNARFVAGQPHDRRRRDELRREQDARHLLRMVRKRQRRQTRRRIRVCARSTLGRRQVIQRFSR